MALETLKGVKEINGVEIFHASGQQYSTDKFIIVEHDVKSITFFLQDGPIKEVGKNGCQVTDMIAVAKHIIEKLNEKFQCAENEQTLYHLKKALHFQHLRTAMREKRGVEGTSNV